jgi:ATP-binding cassette, subfamily B, bacterial PglK
MGKLLRIFKKFGTVLEKGDKAKLAILFFLMVFAAFFEAFSLGILAGFVTVILEPETVLSIEMLKPFFEFFQIETAREILIYGAIFLILIFIIKNIYLIFFNYAQSLFVFNRYRHISRRLFSIYMHVPYTFHLTRNSAELIRNVTSEARVLTANVLLPLLRIMTEVVITIGIVTMLLVVEPLITMVSIFFLGGTSLFFLKFVRNKIQKHGQIALVERKKIIQTVDEGIGGFKDATVMGRQDWFVENFHKSMKKLAKAHVFQEVSRKIPRPIIETVAIVGMLIIVLFLLETGYTLVSLASVLALFALSLQRLLPAVDKIVGEYNSFRYYVYSLEPIYEDFKNLRKYEKEQKEKESMKKLKFKNEIELENISFTYPKSEQDVLKNISCKIKKGTAVGIVGGTGSGKTTLVDLILGLLEPTKGEIKVDGENIKNNLKSWQRNIGYIPQFIYLSDDTIRHNIAFGVDEKEIDEKKVQKAAKMAQLNEFVDKLDLGLDTEIGERGIRLSGGQRQRIGIARALYHNPEVLIMDEATSSLDNVTEKYVIKSIERLKKERTIIIIAHRLTTVKKCDKLYIVKNKKIIDEGKYEELLVRNKDFKRMVEER